MFGLSRRVDFRAVDKAGYEIPGTRFEYLVNGEPGGGADSFGHGTYELPSKDAVLTVTAFYQDVKKGPVQLSLEQSSYTFRFDVEVNPTWKAFMMKHFPAVIGIVFVLIAIVMGFAVRDPTPFQKHLLLAVLSLGGGGVGGEISGFIKTDLKLGTKLVISAGGAAAIFVVLYFVVPAGT